MIDVEKSTRNLVARAISRAPVEEPWTCLSLSTGEVVLLFRREDGTDNIDAVLVTADEDPAQVYVNIAAKYDTRRILDNATATTLLSQPVDVIESPVLTMMKLVPSRYENIYSDLFAIMTPDSVFTIALKSSEHRDANGNVRDDILDDIVFA